MAAQFLGGLVYVGVLLAPAMLGEGLPPQRGAEAVPYRRPFSLMYKSCLYALLHTLEI